MVVVFAPMSIEFFKESGVEMLWAELPLKNIRNRNWRRPFSPWSLIIADPLLLLHLCALSLYPFTALILKNLSTSVMNILNGWAFTALQGREIRS